jgi:tetratricopeptide (TPR) repeat protein
MIRKNYLQTIRKTLKLNQVDITNGKITRITISHIENHRIALTDKTISVILETVNDYLSMHNRIIRLEYEDLFTKNRFRSKHNAENTIKNFEELFDNDKKYYNSFVSEVNDIFNEWNFYRLKVYAYNILGDYLYSNFEYSECLFYYRQIVSIINLYGTSNDIAKSVLKLMRVEIMIKDQFTALKQAKGFIESNANIDKDLLLGISFNLSLIYKHNKEYDDALIELEKVEKIVDDGDVKKLSDILLVRALCYVEQEHYEKADCIYNKLISMLNHDRYVVKKANIYCNMLSLYIKRANHSRISETIYSIFLMLPLIPSDNSYLTGIYLEIAHSYRFMNEYELAYKYYNHSIMSAQLTNKYSILSEALFYYIDLFYELDKLDTEDITQLINSLIFDKKIKLSDRSIFKYLLILSNMERYDELTYLLKQINQFEMENA